MSECAEQPWVLTRNDTGLTHGFLYNPTILPTNEYERPMTEHRILDGSVKYDVEEYKIKTLVLRWANNVFLPRTEREIFERFLIVNATFTLQWWDHDGAEHIDTGYLMADRSAGIYKVGYDFELRLKLTSEIIGATT